MVTQQGKLRPQAVRQVAEASVYFLVFEMVQSVIQIQCKALARTVDCKNPAQRGVDAEKDSLKRAGGGGLTEEAARSPSPTGNLDYSVSTTNARALENAYSKLEFMGFNVGRKIVESLSRDLPRMGEHLDIVKFVCKEFWSTVFLKQVDILRTNHRGVFELLDNNFYWFRFANDEQSTIQDTTRDMTPYLWFPCGLVRGALDSLGISASVVAESAGLPVCKFQIKLSQRA